MRRQGSFRSHERGSFKEACPAGRRGGVCATHDRREQCDWSDNLSVREHLRAPTPRRVRSTDDSDNAVPVT